MSLVTIEDLEREPPDVVAGYMKWASELGGMLERFIAEDDEDESFVVSWGSSAKRAAGVHASEISGCQRRTVYTQLGTEKRGQPGAFWKRKFRAGHLYHQLLQRDFHRMCAKTNGLIRFQDEVKIKPELQPIANELDIHSSCDGVFEFLDDIGGPVIMRVVLEIKSESPNNWPELKAPKPEHLEQVTMYQKVLDIPLAWVFYYNKGTQAVTPSESPWLTYFDHRLWAKIETRVQERREDVRNNRMPDREDGILCEFCPYAWTCDPPYLKKKENMEKAKKARNATRLKARRLIRV